MWILAAAVVTASILGSTHCVGMCGPLAMWASGLGDSASRVQVLRGNVLYHLGRLTTYLLAGGIAGGLGSLVQVGGGALGIQLAAARVVGTVMIFAGLIRLASYFNLFRREPKVQKPSLITQMVAKVRPHVHKLSRSGRAITVGLLTTLLPCGWLYLFALVAAGTGSITGGAVVMAAFWVGTVPALTALVAGTMMLSQRMIKTVPVAAAMLLIVAGGYTAAGRGFANLSSLSDIRGEANVVTGADAVGADAIGADAAGLSAGDSDLPPCCRARAEANAGPGVSAVPGAGSEQGGNATLAAVSKQLETITNTPLPCCVGEQHATSTKEKVDPGREVSKP